MLRAGSFARADVERFLGFGKSLRDLLAWDCRFLDTAPPWLRFQVAQTSVTIADAGLRVSFMKMVRNET